MYVRSKQTVHDNVDPLEGSDPTHPSKQRPVISHVLQVNSRVQLAQFTCFRTWIHRILWTNLVCRSTRVYCEITSFSHDVIPVKPYQFWPSTTRVKRVQNLWQQAEHMYSCEHTWIHVLVKWYQLWTSMTRANWFRNGSLFAGIGNGMINWIEKMVYW